MYFSDITAYTDAEETVLHVHVRAFISVGADKPLVANALNGDDLEADIVAAFNAFSDHYYYDNMDLHMTGLSMVGYSFEAATSPSATPSQTASPTGTPTSSASGAAYKVSVRLRLTGVTLLDFDETAQMALREAMADSLGDDVGRHDVVITAFGDQIHYTD